MSMWFDGQRYRQKNKTKSRLVPTPSSSWLPSNSSSSLFGARTSIHIDFVQSSYHTPARWSLKSCSDYYLRNTAIEMKLGKPKKRLEIQVDKNPKPKTPDRACLRPAKRLNARCTATPDPIGNTVSQLRTNGECKGCTEISTSDQTVADESTYPRSCIIDRTRGRKKNLTINS